MRYRESQNMLKRGQAQKYCGVWAIGIVRGQPPEQTGLIREATMGSESGLFQETESYRRYKVIIS